MVEKKIREKKLVDTANTALTRNLKRRETLGGR